MSQFPKIASVCPYLDRLDSVLDGDFCRMCKRDVYDLTDMDDAERRVFMAACGGDACVRYTMRLSPAVAAAALAAATVVAVAPSAAMAQQRHHKPKHAHVRPARIYYPPTIAVATAGGPAMIEPPKPVEAKPADAKPAGPPTAADDRRTEPRPE